MQTTKMNLDTDLSFMKVNSKWAIVPDPNMNHKT
jgi:hypothetical protein